MFAAAPSYIDFGQIAIWAFWFFFAGLIIYLRREDKREGYPLESERSPYIRVVGWPDLPAPKTFLLPHGHGTVTKPSPEAPDQVNATPVEPWPGAPLTPTGDPMLARVGPGSCPTRMNEADLTHEGLDKIVPMRIAKEFSVAEGDADPRGFAVIGCDDQQAGTISEIWVDRSEPQIRYLEVDVKGGKRVLVPMGFARILKRKGQVKVAAITAAQFANVPVQASPSRITLREEDLVSSYYGGGKLYAVPERLEPFL
ncbi:photosynthetic reaction center subunit H [Candidatus Thiodictyon syntrophicum]|jgi:photosynthetic reaction center H subunit|uniref:Photosynthetic reaction center subunit H n=1 Tax=Candidatus Thiodictyon syntrophicum TaxID=1166950 RepID=A0A2K8UJT6_9GAMM|nr:photosynthetic reaction center subunit H [Candidatus Thiodictyon syntrophicum]AUB85431.1 photosynthetic reaction center subunit H [Candidatus Thiodictyon syntrophicum]